jgi:subtilase family serine protease/RNA polymerase subunit RPABC4/transcription elongation factor Spt4
LRKYKKTKTKGAERRVTAISNHPSISLFMKAFKGHTGFHQYDYGAINMKRSFGPKGFDILRKIFTILIACLIFISLQGFIDFDPVEGIVYKDPQGNLLIDGGSTHIIDQKGGPYHMQGNITVDGAGSTLTIINTTFKFLKGYGFSYNVNVKNQGTLIIENSEITIDTSAGGTEERVNFYVTSANFMMENSSLLLPGNLVVRSSDAEIKDSTIAKSSDGIIQNSLIMNITGSNFLLADSSVKDIKSGEHIYLHGYTNFTAINTYLNLSSSHKLQLNDYTKAQLYGLTVQNPSSNSLMNVQSSNAYVEIFRLLYLTVYDVTNVPVGNAMVTARNYSNQDLIPPPDTNIMDYFDKDINNYNKTDFLGKVILPLRSDNITSSGVDYTGNYLLSVDISTFNTGGGYSLKPYPNFLEQFNKPTHAFKFSTLIPPELNGHYSTARGTVTITTSEVFDSPLQLQQNLKIDGGTLTIPSTKLEVNQSNTERFYILVKNGGKLILTKSTLTDPGNWPLNIYVDGGSEIVVEGSAFKLGDGILSLRGGSTLKMNATTMTGSINSIGPGNKVIITEGSTVSANDIVLIDSTVTFKDININTGAIRTEKLILSAINTTFNQQLTFMSSSIAKLTNVTFPGVSSPTITIKDTSEVNIFWWLTVRVVDGGDNLLEKAMVHLYNYSLSGQKKLYDERETNANGVALFDVYSEKRNASGSFKGIERNYFLNASYRNAKSNGLGTLPLTTNKIMELEFDLAADLVLTGVSIIGNIFSGNSLKINATVKNVGDFDLNTTEIPVRFYINGKILGTDLLLSKLEVDETATVSKDWTASLGDHIINVTVDPANSVGEKNESNNKATKILSIIVKGPDLGINSQEIQFDPMLPTEDSNVTISAKVFNFGEYDPYDNGDPIHVKFYLNDPSISGIQIGTTQIIDSIPKKTFKFVEMNFTIPQTGNYNFFVVVETPFDSDLNNNKANRTLMIYTMPDLYISSEDIQLVPNKVIRDSPVEIRVLVHNIGGTAVSNVGCDFYDGDPDDGGVPIGFNNSIETIEPNGGTIIIQISWKPAQLGSHQIFAIIDPLGLLVEEKTANNIANKTIDVLEKPNLYVTTEDITFDSNPVMEGDSLTIDVLIHNSGDLPVDFVTVRITMDSLDNSPLLPDLQILEVPAKGTYNLHYFWQAAKPNGTHNIYIWIDPDKTIPETIRTDNTAARTLIITKTIDLRVGSEDISLNNRTDLINLDFGKEVAIAGKIWNDGGSPPKSEFIVQFFISDSEGNSQQLGADIKVQSIEPESYVDVGVKWIANASGAHVINLKIDPTFLVLDTNRENNEASRDFRVIGPPDLAVQDDEILFSTGDFVKEGESLSITTKVINRGETSWGPIEIAFYDGDPFDLINVSKQIGEVLKLSDLESLAPAETVRTSWNAEGEGIHEIFVVIDPSEKVPDQDRTNNVASGIVEILTLAPDLMVEEVTYSPSYVMVGDDVNVQITIRNIGNNFAKNVVVDVYESFFEGPQGLDGNLTYDNIPASGTVTNEYQWIGGGIYGEYTLHFKIDPENDLKEFNERNNEYQVNITVNKEPPKPDILFTLVGQEVILVSPVEPRVGDLVSVSVTIRNDGDLAALENFDIVLKIDDNERSRVTIEGLGVRETAVKEFSWKPSKTGTYELLVEIDPELKIVNESRANNVVSRNVVIYTGGSSSEQDIGAVLGAAVAAIVVLVVIVVALFTLLILRKRKITEWAECSECSAKMPPDANICPSCGAEFSDEMECGECHSLISIDDVTCPNCGAVFTEETEEKKKKPFLSFASGGSAESESESEEKEASEESEPKEPKEPEEPEESDESENESEPKKDEKADEEVKASDEKSNISEELEKIEEELDDLKEELDEEEFQEFERALDEEDVPESHDEKKSDLEPGEDSERSSVSDKKDKDDKKTPTPVPVEDSKVPKTKPVSKGESKKSGSSRKSKGEEKKPGKAKAKDEEEEEKEDFITADAPWTAECYKCNARIPLSASICPECGAELE